MPKTKWSVTISSKLLKPAEGGDWTFMRLPQEASDRLPSRNMVAVEGTMNGFPFAAVLEPDSEGGHWLRVEPNLQKGAKASPGDEVEVEIHPPAVEPEPAVPDDLRQALWAAPDALATWEDTTAVARRDWITWMNQGKLAETRRIRMGKMIDMLSKGKRRVCCFDRSGMASKAFRCPEPADEAP